MGAFFRPPAAGVMFFVGAWLLMIFTGIVADDVGIKPFGYATSMVLIIGLWPAIAPAAWAVAGPRAKQPVKRGAGSEPVR